VVELACTCQGPDPTGLGLEGLSWGKRKGCPGSRAQMEAVLLWVDGPPLPGGQHPSAPGLPLTADGVYQRDTSA